MDEFPRFLSISFRSTTTFPFGKWTRFTLLVLRPNRSGRMDLSAYAQHETC